MNMSNFRWEAGTELKGVNGKITVFPLRDTNDYSDENRVDSYSQRTRDSQNRVYQVRWILISKGKIGKNKRVVTTKEPMSKEMDEYSILKVLAGGDSLTQELTRRIYRLMDENRIPIEYREGNSKKIKTSMLTKFLRSLGYKKITIDFVLERVISDPGTIIYDANNKLLVHKRYATE